MKSANYLVAVIALVLVPFFSPGQQLSNAVIWKNLDRLDTSRGLSVTGKLQLLYEWKKESEAAMLPQDSVFARLLHKAGVYEFYSGKNYNTAIALTVQALRINISGRPGSCRIQAASDFFNIAFYYDKLNLLRTALPYYDSAILFAARTGHGAGGVIADARNRKAYVFFRLGDFEKAAEESDRACINALEERDSLRYVSALNQRAQALFFQGKLTSGLEDARTAVALAGRSHEEFQLASALKSQAFLLGGLGDLAGAEVSFRQGIAERVKTNNFVQVAADYNDLGNFYSDSLKSFHKAGNCYLLAIQYARKESDSVTMATAFINLGRDYFYQSEFEKADSCYRQAMSCLRVGGSGDFVSNPSLAQLELISNKDVIQTLFDSRTELLLAMYRCKGDKIWLSACIRTALLSDSLIGEIRHEQVGEQSKLYWRKRTRIFFAHALEACYLAQDDKLAFYFMEKSRSVLLQDKLNELGASAHLPPGEAAKEERLQLRIFELQRKLGSVADTSREGRMGRRELLEAKETQEHYIRSLEKDYPVYHQYKYADEVQPLLLLQRVLAKNKQSFVEYFVEDTVCYALCVQPASTRLMRIGKRDLEGELAGFVRLCSDENALSKGFGGFLASANGLYRLLFEPFHLPAGRVIICQDNELVPFEALSRDSGKAEFLIKDYSFSYVYSARYLLNQRQQAAGRGDFLGIAPVSFAGYKGMADLRLSEEALRNCSTPYHRTKLLLRGEASRQNFMRSVGDYSVTTILTHARADSADEEPVLFLNDSVIRLSELQLLKNPAARLVVLSACQTNAGKNRNGEGVFSLARGFSAAGIPAVAATQWMADEAAIYSISQKLNEYLAQGMNKDEALRKAKLYYMFEDKKGSVLPCYWADMILIGNTEPVAFSKGMNLWWIAGALGIGLILGFVIARLSSGTKPASARLPKMV